MSDRNRRTISQRRVKVQNKTRSTRSKAQDAEWERLNDQLDDALRQTFPASDALSIIQTVRCT
jgi:hypothetical protein